MVDLRQMMARLYETNDYFACLDGPDSAGFEEDYWGTVTDPDGKVRDRQEERDQFIHDIQHLLERLPDQETGTVLDVGCGLGFFLSALSGGWQKHGIEVSKFAAESAKQYGEIHHGTLLDSPYTSNTFDVVLMYHVIEHMQDPVANLLKAREILKPDGLLIIGTPDFDSGCARRFGDNFRLLHDKTHIRLFSNDSMHRFLRDHGFEIRAVEYPFFETRFFAMENLERMFDTSQISPPFYGNFMTFFCSKAK